ncbi:MAG: hypothetical protein HBSAPP02_18920 [Phycisphaerae bacterium]|nr:MAG: glycosyltransferase family 4 protein [Planctomycetia bacterium]RIK69551.1 MAG: hypothetical protein DCC66_08215 [Planctomycetota bacterium]GJQ26860.1 MAG: hypothetical protein HBSAPP02_18920 [Phycisphaerae bacterium]
MNEKSSALARPIRVMIIGTLPPPIGGAGVSLQHLVNLLGERSDVRVTMVNTSGVRGRPLTAPFRFARIVCRMLVGAARAEVVSLQSMPSGIPFIGPFAWLAARIWKRPLMIRMFGGESFLEGQGLGAALMRWIVRRCDLYLAQTKQLVAEAQAAGLRRVEWYATSRPMSDAAPTVEASRPCRKFVFLGHVKPLKGIEELIAAGERMENDVTIDVYGPLMDGLTESRFAKLTRVRYRGTIPAGTGVRVLQDYDAMVFPTYWPGEGYPGVVIEAFAAGLPVIATRWRNIPEIVDDSCGLLIEPRNVDALHDAMQKLVRDAALFRRLRQGALRQRDFFDSRRWVEKFVIWCRELANPARDQGAAVEESQSRQTVTRDRISEPRS